MWLNLQAKTAIQTHQSCQCPLDVGRLEYTHFIESVCHKGPIIITQTNVETIKEDQSENKTHTGSSDQWKSIKEKADAKLTIHNYKFNAQDNRHESTKH
uniref:Uncharacterized protein n=1 Tax=Rhizophora mucronata TaxID=61149 RepID=A0A2P2LSA9_RHIMU